MSLRRSVSNHLLGIVTILGIVLLFVTANLESPRWWLTLPGWLIFAACAAIRFEAIPTDSPYRQAVYLMGLPLLFYFGLWSGAFRNLIRLIFEPSGAHLYAFLMTRSFLVLALLYLASVCVFYGINIQKLRDQVKRLEDRQKNPSTMTISEAEEILDITSSALQDQSDPYCHRVSLLKGYDVFQIDKALKLRIANEFLFFACRDDGQHRFSEALNTYSGLPMTIATLFVPDDQLNKLQSLSPDSPDFFETKLSIMPNIFDADGHFKDSRLASLETTESFGEYCRSIGAEHPNYWKKVYERIGLEYTAASPVGNEYVFVAVGDD